MKYFRATTLLNKTSETNIGYIWRSAIAARTQPKRSIPLTFNPVSFCNPHWCHFMVRLITWYLVIYLWESIMNSSLVKTSIAGTKTFCVPFPFCSLFLTVIQLLCFYSCYSLPPTPIHNFCWGRLKGTKEFIIFEPCHTFLARFLLMRDQDRISPNWASIQYQAENGVKRNRWKREYIWVSRI